MDRGHQLTDEQIKKIEKRLHDEYAEAAAQVEAELDRYLDAFKKKDQKWQEWVQNGKKRQAEVDEWKRQVKAKEKTQKQFDDWCYAQKIRTKETYMEWRKQQLMGSARWSALKERLAQKMLDTNQAAQEIIASNMPEIMALNHNWALYDLEMGAGIDTALSIYSKESIGRILIDDPDLMPGPGKKVLADIDAGKAERWEKQKIQSLMMQQIMRGESIPKMASRMAESLANGDLKASVRNCRTMATNAQNGGRYSAYRRVTRSGYELTIEWAATLDMRTRHEHRMMHGQRRNLDEPFEVSLGNSTVKILYPAQTSYGESDIPQEMIWNCRCTLLAWIKGYEHDTLKKSKRMEGMSFEEWQKAKPVTRPILSQKKKGDAMKAHFIREYKNG